MISCASTTRIYTPKQPLDHNTFSMFGDCIIADRIIADCIIADCIIAHEYNYLPTTSRKNRSKCKSPLKSPLNKKKKVSWTKDLIEIYIQTVSNKGVSNEGDYKGSYEELTTATGCTIQQCRSFWSDSKKMNSKNKKEIWKRLFTSAFKV